MVRIKWKESLLTALLCGGAAWAQQPPMAPPAGGGNSSILTLKEAGKPDQRCRILKTRRTADGKTEYEIQDLATGEIATIVESGSPTIAGTTSPSTSSPLHVSPPPEKALPGPSTTASTRGWFSRPSPLPESPVVPMRTESGRLEPISQLASGTPTMPETQPAPGLLQRVRRLFGRGESDEVPPSTSSSRFLGGASSTPFSTMQRVPSESIPGGTLTPTPSRLGGASSTPFSTMQRMPSGVEASESTPGGTLTPAPSRPSFGTPAAAPTLKGQGAAVTPQASPYANLEPVRLTGAQTLQLARFSNQVNSLSRREVLAILRDSPYPSQREVAVESLATANWHTDPNVIPILIETATEDAAPTVRLACVRCLVSMGANTGPVLETLQKLQSDPDGRVRREVQAARAAFAPAPSANVVPTGLK
jgi:hypothetical protein